MKATNIEWDIDKEDSKLLPNLPSEIKIPNGIPEERVSDYISDITGFCHKRYILEDYYGQKEKIEFYQKFITIKDHMDTTICGVANRLNLPLDRDYEKVIPWLRTMVEYEPKIRQIAPEEKHATTIHQAIKREYEKDNFKELTQHSKIYRPPYWVTLYSLAQNGIKLVTNYTIDLIAEYAMQHPDYYDKTMRIMNTYIDKHIGYETYELLKPKVNTIK